MPAWTRDPRSGVFRYGSWFVASSPRSGWGAYFSGRGKVAGGFRTAREAKTYVESSYDARLIDGREVAK